MSGSSATLSVAPVAAAAAPASTPAAATPAQVPSGLLAAVGLAAGLIVLAGLFVALRRRRARTSVPSVG
jgi:Na+(H+)/acetate symporter ActP